MSPTEELVKEDLIEIYSELFKDYCGVRPHHRWEDFSIDDLIGEIGALKRLILIEEKDRLREEAQRKEEIRKANEAYKAADNRFAVLAQLT